MSDSKPTAASNQPSVLPLDGEIDLHVSPRVAVSVWQMIKQKPAKLVVDMSRVSYIDSSGLAVLIEAMQGVEHPQTADLFYRRRSVGAQATPEKPLGRAQFSIH